MDTPIQDMKLPPKDRNGEQRNQTAGTTQNKCGTRSSLKVNRGLFPEIPCPLSNQELVTRIMPTTKQAHMNEQNLKAVEFLDSIDTRLTIFTDVSAVSGTSDIGAGCFIEKTGETISLAAGEHCSSYPAELVALKEALHHLSTNKVTKARIVTHSLSLVQRVPNIGNMKQRKSSVAKEVFETLVELRDTMKDPLEILWCLSHCDIDGNETADRAAGEGCHLP